MIPATIIFFIVAILGILVFMKPWRIVAKHSDPDEASDKMPKVSVVAYVLRDEENLTEYVDMLLSQDYPDFEVILVCDASAEATAILSEKFENVENLHLTFIPPGSHNLSRRKLAQTIGIKRAAGDVVVTTSTSVMPRGNMWLKELTKPFADSRIDVVCGYVHPVFSDYKGVAKWYRQMDATLFSAQWMAAAAEGAPFRGNGFNMAFRRRLFFEAKGYASTLTLMDGDDDIFIKEICRAGHGALVLSPDSVADTRWGEETDRIHVDLKDRYAFTRKYLPKLPFIKSGCLAAVNWIMLLQLVMAVLILIAFIPIEPVALCGDTSPTAIPITEYLIMAGVNFVCFLAFWLTEILLYRRLASKLGSIRLFWAVYPFMLWRPIGNFLFFLNHFPTRRAHYTWSRS